MRALGRMGRCCIRGVYTFHAGGSEGRTKFFLGEGTEKMIGMVLKR